MKLRDKDIFFTDESIMDINLLLTRKSDYQKKMRNNNDVVYNHEHTSHTDETRKLISF